MIYLICSIMVTMPNGERTSMDLRGYGDHFGSGYIVNLSADAAKHGVANAYETHYRSYQDDFGDECHEE